MPKLKRILKDVDVQFISLVDAGANQKQIIWKSAAAGGERRTDGSPSVQKVVAIVKTDEEKRLVYGIVYTPDEVDSHGDAMDATEIEKAAHAFMRKARTKQVDKQHDYQADEGFVAESWIVRKGDELFPDETGAWAVAIKVEDDATWEQVKKGEIAGLSMGGFARTEEVSKSEEAPTGSRLMMKLRKMLGIEKDFESQQRRSALGRSVDDLFWAMWEAIDQNWGNLEGQKAAIRESIEQFLNHLNGLEEVMKQDTQTPATPAPQGPAGSDLAAVVKSAVEAATAPLVERLDRMEKSGTPAPNDRSANEPTADELQATLAKQQEELDATKAKLDEIAKRSAGRQSSEGRDTVTKSESKGIQFF